MRLLSPNALCDVPISVPSQTCTVMHARTRLHSHSRSLNLSLTLPLPLTLPHTLTLSLLHTRSHRHNETLAWLDEKIAAQKATAPHETPAVFSRHINQKGDKLYRELSYVDLGILLLL
jgi:hypothetical protein